MSSPEPGWYQDPTAPGSHRWWDGARWTDQVLAQSPQGNGLAKVSDWFGEAIRLSRARAGHLFTIIAVISLPATVIGSILAWYAIDGVSLVNLGNPDELPELVGFSGNGAWLVGASFLVSLYGSVLTAGAMTHQVSSNEAADGAERAVAQQRVARGDDTVAQHEIATPEGADTCPWSHSVRFILARAHRMAAAVLVPIGIVVALIVAMTVLIIIFPPLGLLIIAAVVAVVLVLVRLVLASTAAAVGPKSPGIFQSSSQLTGGIFWPLVGRLALLVLTSITVQIFAAFLTAPIVSGFSGTTIDPEASDVLVVDVLGGNPAAYLATRMLGAIISGVALALWSAGLFIIYRDRGGDLDPSLEATHGRALRAGV